MLYDRWAVANPRPDFGKRQIVLEKPADQAADTPAGSSNVQHALDSSPCLRQFPPRRLRSDPRSSHHNQSPGQRHNIRSVQVGTVPVPWNWDSPSGA